MRRGAGGKVTAHSMERQSVDTQQDAAAHGRPPRNRIAVETILLVRHCKLLGFPKRLSGSIFWISISAGVAVFRVLLEAP